MLMVVAVELQTGTVTRQVPNPDADSKLELPVKEEAIPILLSNFQVPGFGFIPISMPREVAEQYRDLLNQALDQKKSDIVVAGANQMPPSPPRG